MDGVQPTAGRLLRWLPLVVIGGVLLFIYRRAVSQPVVAPMPLPPQPTLSAVPAPPAQPTALMRLARWPLFILAALALAWVMVSIPRPYSAIALVVVIAIALNKSRVLAVGAVGLMIDSALTYRSVVHFWELQAPVLLMLLGAVALWATMQLDWRAARIPALPLPALPVSLSARWSELHVGLFLLGVIGLAELIWVNTFPLSTSQRIADSVDTQHLLLVTSISLIVAGLGRASLPRRLPAINWGIVLPVLAITLLGLAVRFWQLHYTTRFFIDEWFFANNIRYLWSWRYIPLTAPFDGVAAEPFLFQYWQSITVELFGRNFVGLRGASAIIGTLTIPAVYLLGRTLFDRKTALLGALLLATFPPHLHFSRIGLSEIAMAFFGAASFAFLARGVIANRRFDYALGGALLGMTHYFHEGGKYLFTPVAALWLAGVWLICRPSISLRNALYAALACALVALPIYTSLLAGQKSLAARMVDNGAGLNGAYWQQLFDSGDFREHLIQHVAPPFLIYVQRPDNTLFYAGGTPLMLAFVAPAFMLGLFYALRRWYRPGPMLLLLWVVATSLGNTLLVDSSNAARFVVAFPALMLLAAAGIRYTLPLIWPEQQEGEQKLEERAPLYARLLTVPNVQFLVMLALAVGIAAAQVDYYFNQHIPAYNQQFRNNWRHRDAQDAVLRSLDFPPGTQIHIISRGEIPNLNDTRHVLDFMASGLELNTLSAQDRTLPDYIASLDRSVDHAFYVDPSSTQVIELLRRHFELLPAQASPYDISPDHQYILYYAPAADTTTP
jgi:4-amino-4-deoxy-L-arabinose transferase-like glycosyltransferase